MKLPSKMHLSHGAYYFVKRSDGKVKWTFLSRDYPDALRKYAGLLAAVPGEMTTENRIKQLRATGMSGLLDRWYARITVAEKTRRTYGVVLERLRIAFAEFEPAQVKPMHFYQYITAKQITDGMASHYRSVMIGAMNLAVEEGLIDQNLMRAIKQYSVKSRDRYLTDAEFVAIYKVAQATLKVIMDLCYLTGQRIGDVMSIKFADLTEDGIAFQQEKTKTRLCVAWSKDLRDVVASAKALSVGVSGMTLLHTRKGAQYSYSTIRTWWDQAVKKSGIENAHIHDIRAKSATDAKKAGVNSMALLGHKSEAVHNRYLRSKETPIVTGIARVNVRQSA